MRPSNTEKKDFSLAARKRPISTLIEISPHGILDLAALIVRVLKRYGEYSWLVIRCVQFGLQALAAHVANVENDPRSEYRIYDDL